MSKLIPFWAVRLSGGPNFQADNRKRGILYVLNGPPRYAMLLQFQPSWAMEYIKWQFRFVDALRPALIPELRIRFHPIQREAEDHGWEIPQRWKDVHPEVAFDNNHAPFHKSLKKCRICVIDHAGTTYTEALAGNKPTILFWNPELNQLTSEAQHDDIS